MKLSHKIGADEYTILNNMVKVFKQHIIKAMNELIFHKPSMGEPGSPPV
jgi:hypothetical protein